MNLFDPLDLPGGRLRNRLGVSPMCQYSCEGADGVVGPWHLHHLASFAAGGFGAIVTEATAVSPEGRISPQDAGVWDDAHTAAWRPVAALVESLGGTLIMQLAHAGVKAGTRRPWDGGGPADVDWPIVGPTALAWPKLKSPTPLDEAGLARVVTAFADGARRAVEAGLHGVELHAAHGYLFHSFLSPLMNERSDGYGGGFEGRVRLLREATRATRAVVPENRHLWVRLSCDDWAEGGWTIDESVRLASLLKEDGADLVDCSSGGAITNAVIPTDPGYQVPFAARIRRESGVPTACVGMITSPAQAAGIVERGEADVVLLGREALRDPHFPSRAAEELGAPIPCAPQYERAYPARR